MDELNLFPPPKSLQRHPGRFEYGSRLSIGLPEPSTDRFRAAIASLPCLEANAAFHPAGQVQCRLSDPLRPEEEGYSMQIRSSGLSIEAASEAGLYRGLTTLGQIAQHHPRALPCLRIEDKPDLRQRGFMLDISRCKVPTRRSLYELVDRLAALKYNQLQLYTEHTFAYRAHEVVWKDASPLTAEDIRDLDAYCFDRYIELVPNQNSFGHMDRWLRHDAYKHLAECPDGYEHPLLGPLPWGGTLRPGPESIAFVSDLFEELLPNFRSSRFNIGGDEPWELGQGWSRERVAREGKRRVYLDHLLKIHDIVSRKGKTMQFWADIILEAPEMAKALPRQAIGLIWGYETDHPFGEQCRAFRESGIPFYVAPGTSSWNSIGGRVETGLQNIEQACLHAGGHGAQGLLLTDWGDFGHHQFPPFSYPAIVWAGALSWNRGSPNRFDLVRAIDATFFQGRSRHLAEAIFRLSSIANAFRTRLPNRSLLNELLFSTTEKRTSLREQTDAVELQACRRRLAAFAAWLGSPNESDLGAKLANRELRLAARLLDRAAEKGLGADHGRSDPGTSGFSELLREYRDLWLARNRPGGLSESVAYLKAAKPRR